MELRKHYLELVSTHSRAKAAAMYAKIHKDNVNVSTHSRAKAAARIKRPNGWFSACFNTQPREGGCISAGRLITFNSVSTHSRAKAAATLKIN